MMLTEVTFVRIYCTEAEHLLGRILDRLHDGLLRALVKRRKSL